MRGVGAGKAISRRSGCRIVVARSVEASLGGDDPHFFPFADTFSPHAARLGAPSRSWGAQAMTDTRGLTPEIQGQWARIRGRLRDEVGEPAYRSWLKSMTLAEITAGRARIAVPTKFLRDWVATHYASRIHVLWNGENSAIAGIEVFVGANSGEAREPEPPPAPALKNGRATASEIEVERAEIGAPLDPRF